MSEALDTSSPELFTEAFVILRPKDAEVAHSKISDKFHVLHFLPGSCIIIRGNTEILDRLQNWDGVVLATTKRIPEAETKGFDGPVLHNIRVWNAGFSEKQRIGEGLPWDVEGFSSP